jgi:hypothetical protein
VLDREEQVEPSACMVSQEKFKNQKWRSNAGNARPEALESGDKGHDERSNGICSIVTLHVRATQGTSHPHPGSSCPGTCTRQRRLAPPSPPPQFLPPTRTARREGNGPLRPNQNVVMYLENRSGRGCGAKKEGRRKSGRAPVRCVERVTMSWVKTPKEACTLPHV